LSDKTIKSTTPNSNVLAVIKDTKRDNGDNYTAGQPVGRHELTQIGIIVSGNNACACSRAKHLDDRHSA